MYAKPGIIDSGQNSKFKPASNKQGEQQWRSQP
jgi:hypothetical protein